MTKKVNLYEMHDNLAAYLKSVLESHNRIVEYFGNQLAEGELEPVEYFAKIQNFALPPALLTVIATFLKTNDIKVIHDDLGAELDAFEAQLEENRKLKASIGKLDHKADVN